MKRFFRFSLIFVISLSIISCLSQSEREDIIVGQWQLLGSPSVDFEKFSFFLDFNEESQVSISFVNNETSETKICARGAYIFKNNVLTISAGERFCNGFTYYGDWRIENINDRGMLLYQDFDGHPNLSGTIFLELEKVEIE